MSTSSRKHPWVQSVSADAPVAAFRSNRFYNRFRIPASQRETGAVHRHGASTNVLRQTLGLSNVAAPGSVNGDGVVVALIDSGISPNADVPLSRIAGFYDFTRLANGQPTQPAPYDDFGHGTHVAGLLGSSGVLSNYQYQGVAPAVKFVALKVLDGQGQGSTSTVIKAIEFVIAHNDTLRVKVINLSLGHPIYAPAKYDPLVQAVERASAAGIVVVVAAGNNGLDQNGDGESGYTGINSPANAPSCIAVGAVDTKNSVTRSGDVVAAFSSRGPTWFDGLAKPDVVAPGVHLISNTDTLVVSLHEPGEQSADRERPPDARPERHEHGGSDYRGRRRAGARRERRADTERGQSHSRVHRHQAAERRRADAGRRRNQRGRRGCAGRFD